MEELISIIIPVYNASLHLKKLNDTLVNQTYRNIEIIYINDGSTDQSLNLLNEFAREDNRVIVINHENSGPAISRNKGLEYSTGKYIMFADSDDFLDLDMIENMYKVIVKEKADIVICNYRDVLPDGKIVRINKNASKFAENNIYKNPEILFMKPAVWNKMVNVNLIRENNIEFKAAHIGEDLAFTLKLLSKAENVIGIPNNLYNYVLHENTISRTYDKRVLDLLISLDSIYDYFQEENLITTFKEEIDYITIQNILYQITKVPLIEDNKEVIYQQLVDYLLKIDNLYGNKYVKRSLVYSIIIRLFPKKFFIMNPISQFFLKMMSTSDLFYKIIRRLDK